MRRVSPMILLLTARSVIKKDTGSANAGQRILLMARKVKEQ